MDFVCVFLLRLKLHEDWGTTPAAIDCALTAAEKHDVQVNDNQFYINYVVGRDSQTVGWSLAVSVILRCLLKVLP